MDNFKIIYKILRYLEKAMDYDEPDMDFISAKAMNISERKWSALMEMMVEEGYIDGVSVTHSLGGDVLISGSNPRITLRGLEYLNENSLMAKAAKLAKGVADAIP